MTDYKEKYLKYKNKYLELKAKLDSQKGGNYYAKGTYALFLNELQTAPETNTGKAINSSIIKNFDNFTTDLGSCALFLRIGSTFTGLDLTHSYDTVYSNRSATNIVGTNVSQAAKATYDVSKQAASQAYDVSKQAASQAYDVSKQAASKAYDYGNQAYDASKQAASKAYDYGSQAYDVSKQAASKAYDYGSQAASSVYDAGRNVYGQFVSKPSTVLPPGAPAPGTPNGPSALTTQLTTQLPSPEPLQQNIDGSNPGMVGSQLGGVDSKMSVKYSCDYKPMRISDLSEQNIKNFAYVSSLNPEAIKMLVSRINNNVEKPITVVLIVQKLGNTTNDAEINKRYDIKYSGQEISEVTEFKY